VREGPQKTEWKLFFYKFAEFNGIRNVCGCGGGGICSQKYDVSTFLVRMYNAF